MNTTQTNKDLILIARFKEGDTSAFRQLVESYKDVSFTLACSIIKDENTAEDILQDAFIKVYQNLHKFQNKSSFATWLYKIVVNTCFDVTKKQGRNIPTEEVQQEINTEYSYAETSSDELLQSERQAIIQSTLSSMKTDEALVLRLHYLSELSIQEIIEITGYSASKIKVTLHRGRKNLHDNLKVSLGQEIKSLI